MPESGGDEQGGGEHVDKTSLIAYMTDGLAAMRMAMRAYEAAIARVSDEDVRIKIGEFKADAARGYEMGRVAVRSLGGDVMRGKEALATMGAAMGSALMGVSRRDLYAEAREVKNLVGGEHQALFDFERTLEIAERIGHEPTATWARGGVEAARRHLEYLEPKARELLERAILHPRAGVESGPRAGSAS